MTAIVVHGTWGRFSEFCRENNNPEGKNDPQKQSFRHMKQFVSELSTYFGQAAEIISFGWSGERSHRARDEGGVFLAEYLNRAYKHTDRIFIGHSHGNNLINAATNEDSMQNNPAKLLIYFACPQRPEKQYRPKHFNQLIYFLSHDPIDRGGSVPEGWPQFMAGAILGGSVGYFVAPKLLSDSSSSLSTVKDIVLGVSGAAATGVALATAALSVKQFKNDALAPQEEKIVVQVDTTHNGDRPDHSQIFYKTIQLLPQIIYQLQNQPEYAKSGSFYLDIKSMHNEIELQVKKQGKIPAIVDFTKFGSASIFDYDDIFSTPKDVRDALVAYKVFTISSNELIKVYKDYLKENHQKSASAQEVYKKYKAKL